ncbi:MAG: hypothetical protein H7A26_02710 [Spirochaetales bacterium]|nr:hypothetical protein [Spirochaetales bacterium]
MINKKKYKTIIVLLTVLNLIVIILISYLLYTNTVRKKEFNITLNKIDLSISRNAFESAESAIKRIFPFAVKKTDYMRILKRAYIISDKTGNNDLLISVSEKAFDRFSKDQDIFTVYIYSLVQNKKYEKAAALLERNSKITIPDSFSSVILSAIYKNTGNDEILLKISDNDITTLLHNFKNPDLYEKIFNISDKPFVLNNYILSLLSEGKFDRAENILGSSISAGSINRELSALVFYDNSHYNKAEKEFIKIHEDSKGEIQDNGILMLLADALMYQGKINHAETVYEIVLDSDKYFSWIPYINIDWINIKQKKESYRTEDAVDLFPEDRELLFMSLLKSNVADNGFTEGEYNSIITLNSLNNLKNMEGPLYPVKKEKQNSNFSRSNQDRYINEFWSYFNDDRMSSEFKLFFAKELYRLKRFDDLSVFISKEKNKDEDWAIFYGAALAFSKRNYSNSLNLFTRYYKVKNNWEALYNIGLVNLVMNQYDTAINSFSNILKSTLKNRNIIIDENNISDVYLMLSLSYLMAGSLKEGEASLDNAVKTGNKSLTALYLRKYYKSKIVEEGLYK